eukprot:TRINITY_DN1557_c0_g1_i1.p1 TRINITY_DN1557_c0_g1~~TRINITY_DN1557_c0_g1_i1.p1  ORF type:complete len:349 (-),score=94.23 TRINITY_DN1557_c0_g1_i1:110-1156(-)
MADDETVRPAIEGKELSAEPQEALATPVEETKEEATEVPLEAKNVDAPSGATDAVAVADTQGTKELCSDTKDVPAAPDDEALKKAVREIVEQGDINTLTVKTILQALEQRFGLELPTKKGLVRNVVGEIVQEREDREQKEQEQQEQARGQETNGQDSHGEAVSLKTKKSPKAAKSKMHPTNRKDDDAANDEEEAYVDVDPKDIQLQKLILEAAKFSGGAGGRTVRRAAAPKPKMKNSPVKKRKSGAGDEVDDDDADQLPPKKKRASVFSRPVKLKGPLSDFLGVDELPRGEIVKRIVAYVKEHNLQSIPGDRRKIVFDDKLQQVFKCKQTDFFKLQKLITTQVFGIND